MDWRRRRPISNEGRRARMPVEPRALGLGSGTASLASDSRPATPNRSDPGTGWPNAISVAWILDRRCDPGGLDGLTLPCIDR